MLVLGIAGLHLPYHVLRHAGYLPDSVGWYERVICRQVARRYAPVHELSMLAAPHGLVGGAHVLDVDEGVDAAALLQQRQGLSNDLP